MSNVSIAGYAGWPTYDTFLIMLLSGWPVYDPNPLRPNPNLKKPMLGSCRVRGLGQTLTLLTIADKKLEEICPQIRTINIYIYSHKSRIIIHYTLPTSHLKYSHKIFHPFFFSFSSKHAILNHKFYGILIVFKVHK